MRLFSRETFRHPFFLITLFFISVGTLTWIFWGVYKGSEPRTLGFNTQEGVLELVVPENLQVNQPFAVEVRANTKNNNINAAGIYLQFDTSMLQLLQQDTRASFCQFYPEKKYDNRLGTISLACGSPHPGFNGSNTLMILEFMPIRVGTARIMTDTKSTLLKSDGKGSNILHSFPVVDIHIGNTP